MYQEVEYHEDRTFGCFHLTKARVPNPVLQFCLAFAVGATQPLQLPLSDCNRPRRKTAPIETCLRVPQEKNEDRSACGRAKGDFDPPRKCAVGSSIAVGELKLEDRNADLEDRNAEPEAVLGIVPLTV